MILQSQAYRRAWAELASVAAADDSGATPGNLFIDDTGTTEGRVASTIQI